MPQKIKKEIERKIICKNCYSKDHFDGEDYCKIIGNESGGSILANKIQCEFYLKKGTEPKLLCCKCGKNTYGESAIGEGGKWYCSDCHIEKEHKEWLKREKIKKLKNIEEVSRILGGNEKIAKKIIASMIL